MPATVDVPCISPCFVSVEEEKQGFPSSGKFTSICILFLKPFSNKGNNKGEMVNSRTREGNISQEPRSCYSNRKKGSSQKTVEGTSETQPKEFSKSKVGQYKQRNITSGSYLKNKIKIRKSILILINCRINECIVERRYSSAGRHLYLSLSRGQGGFPCDHCAPSLCTKTSF